MTAGQLLIIAAILSACGGIFCMIRIVSYLRWKGERINWFLLRLRWFTYMSRYRELTTEEYGKPGKYLTGYIVFMLAALVQVVAGALLLNQAQ